ncbi:MAG: tRNA (adenine57-N1/adenine58-N1)-methyltransferase catalytic subunit [Candidatus Binatota bacterium]|jgi:tRNA (adenine57-N1/adenine58-N1)-methyltransferase|nr:tRNA (adenine57-N1/adenine58-N1)-methyltransferase catalytic subunit [Candidatus Binatota bacterium]
MPENRAALRSGDYVLFIDRKDRQYLKAIRAGSKIIVRGGTVEADALIGLPEGSRVRSSANETFLVIRPTYAQLIPNLPRQAQVIYPKDAATILLWGDVHPGATVVEAGVGPGALTIALLRAIGPDGKLISYELRDDFRRMARQNVERFFGTPPNWSLEAGDVYESIPAEDVDRLVLDVAEPWRALDHVAKALRPGGVFVGYLPTVLQVKALVDAIDAHPLFGLPETLESLVRGWYSRGPSLRPNHRMVAHTGFLTIARRLP